MKKLYYLIVLALILGLVLTGCTLLSNIGQAPATERKPNIGGTFPVGTLVAGKNTPVGTVDVWNDFTNLYVKYVITDLDWCLTETHLAVATASDDIPQTKKENPIPGQFPYQCCYDETEGEWLFVTKPEDLDAECSAEWSTETCLTAITYTIPLSEIDEGVEPEELLFIAAHASLLNMDNIVGYELDPDTGELITPLVPIYQEETAWADGSEFEGKNWATYFECTVQPPLPLDLYEKTGDPDWEIVDPGAYGLLEYYPFGSTFDFVFNGYDLKGAEGTGYTLIYYPDPWPGNGLICLGIGTVDSAGEIYIEGPVEINTDLPITGDTNAPGAKIWLVLSDDVDCSAGSWALPWAWNATEYLFENNLITFDDVDVP